MANETVSRFIRKSPVAAGAGHSAVRPRAARSCKSTK